MKASRFSSTCHGVEAAIQVGVRLGMGVFSEHQGGCIGGNIQCTIPSSSVVVTHKMCFGSCLMCITCAHLVAAECPKCDNVR
jgi:hypothetical protein